jgi:hypothetical protein
VTEREAKIIQASNMPEFKSKKPVTMYECEAYLRRAGWEIKTIHLLLDVAPVPRSIQVGEVLLVVKK